MCGAECTIVLEGIIDAAALRGRMDQLRRHRGSDGHAGQLLAVARLVRHVVVMLDGDEGGTRGRQALEHALGHATLPRSLAVGTTVLQGTKDAATPGCTAEHVAAALALALPVHI